MALMRCGSTLLAQHGHKACAHAQLPFDTHIQGSRFTITLHNVQGSPASIPSLLDSQASCLLNLFLGCRLLPLPLLPFCILPVHFLIVLVLRNVMI